MNADDNLSEDEVSTRSRPELLLDEEGLRLFPFDDLEEEMQKRREQWQSFKSP